MIPRTTRLTVLLILLTATLLAGVFTALSLWHSGLPRRTGNALIISLKQPVTVRWDNWGAPYVDASSVADAVAALGYLHANDRFFQMELGRRRASGRLAEIFGSAALPSDREFLRLGFPRLAKQHARALRAASRGLLQAYADGVNAWITERGSDLPPEFRLLRIRPELWEPRDSIYFYLLMANELSFWAGRPEERRLRWLRRLGPEAVRDLLGDAGLTIPSELLDISLTEKPTVVWPPTRMRDTLGGPLGSNNWALDGIRSVSGSPLVANDPHLPLSLPGTWYQALLRSPDYEASGMTIPGLPLVVIGRSQYLSWSLTNTMLDDHDLFIEQLDDSRKRVARASHWAPIETFIEEIPVRNSAPETIVLQFTELGPLLPAEPKSGLPARSLVWSAAVPSNPLAAVLGLARSRSLEELTGKLGSYIAPAQNLVVAHRDGGLLYTMLGRVPDRTGSDGRMPSPAWNDSYRWRGLRTRASNPTILNPPTGMLVTANSNILPTGYALPFTAEFDTPHRTDRIRQLLEGQERWAMAGLSKVQNDLFSSYALELIDLMKSAYTGEAARAYDLLARWDGSMELSGTSALFAIADRMLPQAIFADELAPDFPSALQQRKLVLRALKGDMDPCWFDDQSTERHETRADLLNSVLTAAWIESTNRWGDDPKEWNYGSLHQLTLRHPLGSVPLVGRLLNQNPVPLTGSATTIAAFSGSWHDGLLPILYGPSMRWITDAAHGDRTVAILPAGQSGHPGDRHYDDQKALYLAGKLRPVPWSPGAIELATVSQMVLRPHP